jgi:hypothetical protein
MIISFRALDNEEGPMTAALCHFKQIIPQLKRWDITPRQEKTQLSGYCADERLCERLTSLSCLLASPQV